MEKLIDVIKLLRATQWLKNVFIFAPLIFSRHLFESYYFIKSIIAFICFCLASSVVYIINDIMDRETDRHHPIKRHRPIAAGRLKIGVAIGIAVILSFILVILIPVLPELFWYTLLVYVVANLLYTFWLKKIVLVDVFIVAGGFMLRVLAGVFAINVEISPWLILCTLFISVFLAFSKRRGELILSSSSENYLGRHVLKYYDVEFIDQIMVISASGMAISYALYTVAERTIHIFGTENLIFSTVFVLFGIFRYIWLVRQKKVDDNPMHILLSDYPSIVNILLWFITCVIIIYI